MGYETFYDRYNELMSLYKIAHGEVPDPDNYDVIVERVGSGYAHTKYRVLLNKPKLSNQDIAIICDKGNLCFGYRREGSLICVYTD